MFGPFHWGIFHLDMGCCRMIIFIDMELVMVLGGLISMAEGESSLVLELISSWKLSSLFFESYQHGGR